MIRAIGWAAKAILADFAHPIVARWGWAWITIVLAGLAGLVAVTDIIAAVGQAPTILITGRAGLIETTYAIATRSLTDAVDGLTAILWTVQAGL